MHLRTRLVTLGLLTFLLIPAACHAPIAPSADATTPQPLVILRATTASGFIGQQQAIALARDYCHDKAIPQGTPKVTAASLVTMEDAKGLGVENLSGREPGMMVWVIKMDGLWLLYGPPSEGGTPSAPIELRLAMVVIDARTGEMVSINAE
jgi:hypothetical protein